MEEHHGGDASGAAVTSALGDDHEGDGGESGHGQQLVTVTVNDKAVEIHRGHRTVSEIKRLGAVLAADELALAVEGQPLKPLADDGSFVIKGGEEFVSYPKDSSSSFASPVE